MTAEIVRPKEIPGVGIRRQRSSPHSRSQPFACRRLLSSFVVGHAREIGATHLLPLRRIRATTVRITIPNTMTTPSSTNPATNKVLSVSSFIGWWNTLDDAGSPASFSGKLMILSEPIYCYGRKGNGSHPVVIAVFAMANLADKLEV